MQWVETTGRTIDEAKSIALDQLGVADDDAEFEILEEPKAGLFGRTRGEAPKPPEQSFTLEVTLAQAATGATRRAHDSFSINLTEARNVFRESAVQQFNILWQVADSTAKRRT